MSWSRWSPDSAVYTFPHVGGFAECCSCPFGADKGNGFNESFTSTDLDEFLQHIAKHVEARHAVPSGLVEQIREEWDEFIGAKAV